MAPAQVALWRSRSSCLRPPGRRRSRNTCVDGTGLPSFTFTPLGSGVQGEMSDDTINWLTAAALAVAKRHSDR